MSNKNARQALPSVLYISYDGMLVPVQDASSLAAAMTASLIQPVDREALMSRAKDFSVSTIADQYFAYFSEKRA